VLVVLVMCGEMLVVLMLVVVGSVGGVGDV